MMTKYSYFPSLPLQRCFLRPQERSEQDRVETKGLHVELMVGVRESGWDGRAQQHQVYYDSPENTEVGVLSQFPSLLLPYPLVHVPYFLVQSYSTPQLAKNLNNFNHFLFSLQSFFLIEGQLLYNIALVFANAMKPTWISHRYTYVPSLSPSTPSHSSRLLQRLGLTSLNHAANSHWLLFILHMSVYLFPCYSLHLSHPLLPLPHLVFISPQVYKVDESRAYYTEWSKSEREKYHILMHLYI